ncbi:MAG: hypothetical protein IJP63_04355 [Acholeplasmatales bacterium]|nr:hypothetical protein [Acholeplasmatales bacterium]
MNKRSIINKMILLSSISACALLFSCGKSETETKDKEGNTIEFENITSDEIEINRVRWWDEAYTVLEDTYAISRTDSLANSSHDVNISYGIGDRLLNHIKKYENEVELFEKTQELKLSIFRICYANYQDFSIGQNIARNPYYNVYFNNLPDYEKKSGRNIETYIDGTNYEDYYSRVEVYSEINNLEYYFSDDFKYGKLEIIDNITKDDLKPFVKRDCSEEYGLLQYSFLLEPVDSDDEIIKYGRISDGSGNERTYTKNGVESVSWNKGDYAFPLYEANDGTVQVNRAALRMLTSYVSNCIPYVIEGNNVTFNTSKEVA